MRNDGLHSKADRMKRGPAAAVTFKSVADEAWARVFGTPEEIAARRRAAIEEQKRAQVVEAQANSSTAIHTDKLYAGWDPALKVHFNGRADRREYMRNGHPLGRLRCAYE